MTMKIPFKVFFKYYDGTFESLSFNDYESFLEYYKKNESNIRKYIFSNSHRRSLIYTPSLRKKPSFSQSSMAINSHLLFDDRNMVESDFLFLNHISKTKGLNSGYSYSNYGKNNNARKGNKNKTI